MTADVDPAPEKPAREANGRFRLVLLGVLVLALLASAGTLVWLVAQRQGGDAGAGQSERDAVLRQTEQFVLRLNTYGPDGLDDQGHLSDYQKQVTAVITSKFGADFEKSGLPIAEQTVAQAGYARSVKVLGVGVVSIDADSAKVIIAAMITGSYPDRQHPDDASKRIASDPDVLRSEVDLVRSGDSWLVDDFQPVETGAGK